MHRSTWTEVCDEQYIGLLGFLVNIQNARFSTLLGDSDCHKHGTLEGILVIDFAAYEQNLCSQLDEEKVCLTTALKSKVVLWPYIYPTLIAFSTPQGPNLCELPRYVIGTEPSPAPDTTGAFVVGRTPYRP